MVESASHDYKEKDSGEQNRWDHFQKNVTDGTLVFGVTRTGRKSSLLMESC